MKKSGKRGERCQGGFTLVELIVVMAIMALLAGIAIPTYLGYIKKAREQQNLLDARQLRIAVATMLLEQSMSVGDLEDNDVYASTFWKNLGDKDHPFHGVYPSRWDPDGTIAELTVDDNFNLTNIVYQGPDGSREIWKIEDVDGGIKVEIQTE